MSGTPDHCGVELGRIVAGKTHAPVVYFARIGDSVKIGTSTNLKSRMRDFYLSLEDVLAVLPGGPDVEAAYHKRFASSRYGGDRRELFRMDANLSLFLTSLRSTGVSAAAEGADPQAAGSTLTLRQACAEGTLGCSLDAARKAAQRPGFPEVVGRNGPAALYFRGDLARWQKGRVRVSR